MSLADQSVFTSGDMVLQNPKETGVIFSIVVFLAVILEVIFGAFRDNKSKYVKQLFTQISEEIMIVGTIVLAFGFSALSFSSELSQRVIMLFRWSNTVLFFMMILFVLGIILTALWVTLLLGRLKKFEETAAEQNITILDNLDFSTTERVFLSLRLAYTMQVKRAAEAAPPKSLESEIVNIPFSSYLYTQSRSTIVKFADVTWQCWLSLIFLCAANSIRLFFLPGRIWTNTSETEAELTDSDNMANLLTYIFIIGWLPAIGYVSGVVMLVRRTIQYQNNILEASKKKAQSGSSSEPLLRESRALKPHIAGVWIPPKQLLAEAGGEMFEDPSIYLLRANRSYTLHALKIPAICVELYLSIFAVGMWGQMSMDVGVIQVVLIPLVLLPVIVVFALLPIALMIVVALTSLGCRLDIGTLKRLAYEARLKNSAEDAGHGQNDDENVDVGMEEMVEQQRSTSALMEDSLGRTASFRALRRRDSDLRSPLQRRDTTLLGSSFGQNPISQPAEDVLPLKQRIKFLEDLCIAHGLPIERTIGDDGSYKDLPHMAGLFPVMTKLQEDVKRIAEQQAQIAAMQRMHRLSTVAAAASDGEAAKDRSNEDSSSALKAISAARRFDALSGRSSIFVSSVQRPMATSAQMKNIDSAVGL